MPFPGMNLTDQTQEPEHTDQTERMEMIRVVHKCTDFKEAEDWDIHQQVQMSPEERQEVAAELRQRIYGKEVPDVREARQEE